MRVALGFALLAATVIGSPAAAQSTTVQLPPADQTAHSVPPAPPPERRSELPPPFPPMSRKAPHQSRARVTHTSGRISHRTNARHETVTRAKRHDQKTAVRTQTKQDKKNERFCAALSPRKALHNRTCRKLAKAQHEAVKPHELTKQERKDERRCSGLSLRQVMRDSRCRKVAERQLATSRDHDTGKKPRHRHETVRKADKKHEHTATRSRTAKHHRS